MNDLTGITFHVSDPNRVQVAVNGGVVSNSQMTITPHTIGFPWYSADSKDYTVWSEADLAKFNSNPINNLALLPQNKAGMVTDRANPLFLSAIGIGVVFYIFYIVLFRYNKKSRK